MLDTHPSPVNQLEPAAGARRSIRRSILHTFFRLLYHEMAWAYDLVAWTVSLGQWTAWGRAAIPFLRGQRVLELAHGPGHLLLEMCRTGLVPVGLDLSPQMGRLAHSRLRQAGREAALVRARAQALPFRSGAFDTVVTTFPTEFIVETETLREVARVIGQGGHVVVVPGVVFGKGAAARALEWIYTVTGQQEPEPPGVAAAMAEVGLRLERRLKRMGLVDVLIAVAEKREARSSHSETDPGEASARGAD